MLSAPEHDDWTAITAAPLPVADALAWATTPGSGGLVSFSGTVRDHSEGRVGVTSLDYEVWEPQASARLAEVVRAARARWPELCRVAVLHRTGHLELTEVSVLVVVSAPHRGAAFDAARFCIDTVKTTVPIWKRETWAGGADWSRDDHEIAEASGPGSREESVR